VIAFMKTILPLPVLLLLLLAAPPLPAQEVPLSLHGANDPRTEGFVLSTGPNDVVGPVANDYGRAAWSVLHTDGSVSYSHFLATDAAARLAGHDWTLSATLRLVQAPRDDPYLMFLHGSEGFFLTFSLQPDGDPVVSIRSSLTPVWSYEGGGEGGYHTYELRYQVSAGAASLWVDNEERMSGIAGEAGWSGWFVGWGAASQARSSLSHLSDLSLTVIPEPTTASLLVFGAVALWGGRRGDRGSARRPGWGRRFTRLGQKATAIALLLLAVIPTPLLATEILGSHQGANDLTGEGFSVFAQFGIVGPAPNDFGYNAWRMYSSEAPVFYLRSLALSEQGARIGAHIP